MAETYFGINENTESALAYLLWFVTGIFFFLLEDRNRTVRFHALQSTLFSLFLVVLIVAMSMIPLFAPYVPLVWLVEIICWLALILTAYAGRKLALPVIGGLAEKWS